MTTNPTPIPEPTNPTPITQTTSFTCESCGINVEDRLEHTSLSEAIERLVGWNKPGSALCEDCWPEISARPTKVANCARCDRIEAHALGIEGLLGRRRNQLAKARGEIDQLKARIAELEAAKPEPCECLWCVAAQRRDRVQMDGMVIAPCDEYGRTDREATKPEPGPWLRGDELDAALPTLKAGDVVEVEHEGHRASGELWANVHDCLFLWGSGVRWDDGESGFYVDALRIIERAPEPDPGADIPDEVIEAAWSAFDAAGEVLFAALAAADAKRAELAGGVA